MVGASDTSSSAELFRLLRTNLLFILNDTSDKVVLMTSTNSGEGKSFISINLAMSLSLLGKKVLLVGMDIRKPKLSEYLGVNAKFGVTQYLSSDKISIGDMVVNDPRYGDLDIILSGPIPPNPAELLASKKVDEFFEQIAWNVRLHNCGYCTGWTRERYLHTRPCVRRYYIRMSSQLHQALRPQLRQHRVRTASTAQTVAGSERYRNEEDIRIR